IGLAGAGRANAEDELRAFQRPDIGGSVERSDVEGAIRMAVAADDQLRLPTMERKDKLTMAQVSTRKKTIIARTPTQDAY
ncbi:hypothetical protein ACC760_39400, partial [Rhizobium ruizarguesonis]